MRDGQQRNATKLVVVAGTKGSYFDDVSALAITCPLSVAWTKATTSNQRHVAAPTRQMHATIDNHLRRVETIDP